MTVTFPTNSSVTVGATADQAFGTLVRARAVAMWDFSWLERRWPGAGYDDIERALDELTLRGYDAVRIDAYPHLAAIDPARTWTLKPVWDQQVWGSPGINRVRIQPDLVRFIQACQHRGIGVGLSSWYREDLENSRLGITSARQLGAIWVATLGQLSREGLLDSILWVDVCNEWPGDLWAPFFRNEPSEATWGCWHTSKSMDWMRCSMQVIRKTYPDVPLCFSFDSLDDHHYFERDLSFFDLFEHHCWMAKENDGQFAKEVGYGYETFSPQGYINLAERGERIYRERPDYWWGLLTRRIESLAQVSEHSRLPLVTTECWGVVDYKDWPLLDWGWVKELCVAGALAAAETGRWAAIATSNFCGPQFAGMWSDISWHRRLTDRIKRAPIAHALHGSRFCRRLADCERLHSAASSVSD